MKNRLGGALALAVVALLGGAVAVWGADPAFPIQITKIAIEGNDHVATRDIEKGISLKVGDTLNGESDLKASSEGIFALGWFSEVLPEIAQDGLVVFHVVENPVIEDIEITGNTNEQDVRLLGLTLFRIHTMPSDKIKQILRDHGIRTGKTFRSSDLKDALDEVIAAYKERGYVLVMVGDVKTGATLSIEIIEGRVAGQQITGLFSVPVEVARALVELPTDEMLRQADLTAAVSRLRKSVFFSDVSVTLSAGPTRDSVILNWALTERPLLGAPADVRSIVLDGVTQFPVDVVAHEIGALPAGPVDNYAALKAVEGVFNLYMRAGFIMVRFSMPRIDGDVLHLRVDEGVVSEIALEGETATQQRVLGKTLDIRVGRILTSHDLTMSYQQVNALGYYDSITIDPLWTETGVRVAVSVSNKTQLGGLTGSVAYEPASGGIVGELSVREVNLFGTGQDVSLSYKRDVSPEGEPGASTWQLGYRTLAMNREFNWIATDLYRKTKTVSEGDDSTSYLTVGGDIQFSYPVADYTDLVLGYQHDLERKLAESAWQPIDAISLSIREDSTDDPTFPTRGTRRGVALAKAGGFAVGKEYTKLDLTWTCFTPLYEELLPGAASALAIRLLGGFGDDGVAGSQAYELGGSTTVRGIEGVTVKRMAVANAEYRLKLTDGFTVTAFLDAGMNLDSICSESMVASTGLEFGISAAGMFVRLDVVWALSEDLTWMPRFDFGFGPMF